MSCLINSREKLLVHTQVILSETGERYELFADQLRVANNTEIAELFDELAAVEHKRAANTEQIAAGMTLPRIAPWELTWGADHSPELPDIDAAVHYLMNQYQALTLAIDNEQWAAEFFNWVADGSSGELRDMAREFCQHAERFKAQLVKRREAHPPPQQGWDEDPDPPVFSE